MNLIANRRRESGFSVAELGQRAGVDRGTVWRIEHGLIAHPKAESLLSIGKVLHIPSTELFQTVGWLVADELPDLGSYLRSMYRGLPDAAIADIENCIAHAVRRYGATPVDDHEPQDIRPKKGI